MKTGIYFGMFECEIKGPIVVYGAQSVNADDVIRLADEIKRNRYHLARGWERHRDKFERVARAVCNNAGVSMEELTSKGRRRVVADARHMVSSIIRELHPSFTFAAIGYFLGYRDHSTVISSIQKHEELVVVDPDYRDTHTKTLAWLRSEA